MRFECWEKQIAAKKSECGESDNAESTAAALDRARHATLGSPAALVQRPHFCRSGQTPRALPLALLGPRDRRQKVARLHHCRQIRVRQPPFQQFLDSPFIYAVLVIRVVELLIPPLSAELVFQDVFSFVVVFVVV